MIARSRMYESLSRLALKLMITLAATLGVACNLCQLAQGQQPIDFAIVAPPTGQYAQIANSLYRVLIGRDQRAKFQRVETLDAALATSAEVIVIAIEGNAISELEQPTLQALKQRKLVGIGGPAAKLFSRLGLEMNQDNCALIMQYAPELTVMKSELLGAPATSARVPVTKRDEKTERPLDQAEKDRNRIVVQGLFQPMAEATVIDVIGRWSDDANYAIIARQGNCVLIGVEAPTNLWSREFIELVDATCMALRNRKLEEFSVDARELTQPGMYEFELDKCHSTERLFQKRFYFRFDRPTRITARLEHVGSKSVCLSFFGRAEETAFGERADALQGEKIELVQEINAEQVAGLEGHYCELSVTNYDNSAAVKCKLVIVVE